MDCQAPPRARSCGRAAPASCWPAARATDVDLSASWAPLIASTQRFGCATVYELVPPTGGAGPSGRITDQCGCSRFEAPIASRPTSRARSSTPPTILIRELMDRNSLSAGGDGELHLHAHRRSRRRVSRARRAAAGAGQGAAAVRAGGPGPRLAAAGRPAMLHYYAAEDHQPRHVYLGAARALRPTSRRHNRSDDGDRVRRAHPPDPGVPAGGGLRPRRGHRHARLQRVLLRARARGDRGRRRRAGRRPPLSGPVLRGAARRAVGPLRVPASGSRSATARATSCCRPARRCWSPAPRSSTRGPRSASTRTWPPPPAPGRSRSRWTTRTATTSMRWPPRSRSPRGWC